jgi:hypothetical protein
MGRWAQLLMLAFAAIAVFALGASGVVAHEEPSVKMRFPEFKAPPEPKPRPGLSLDDVRAKGDIKNFEVLGQAYLTWPGGGGQIALRGNYAYVGLQPPSLGTDVIDVSDPARPRRVGHVDPPGPGVYSHKVRICGDVMVTNAERNRYGEPKVWQGGLVVWSLANPVRPKQIGFLPVDGDGVHRIFYDCDTNRVYMNADEKGYLDKVEWIVDMSDPRNPRKIGHMAFPGQKDGEARPWTPGNPFLARYPASSVHVHNVTPVGDLLYAAWWDAGLTVWNIADPSNPKLLGSSSTSPPDQGSMHSAWPLRGYPIVVTSDEWFASCPQGYVRIWNVVDPTRPLQISTFQLPSQKSCAAAPKNGITILNSVHSFAEPATLGAQDWPVHLIFATWFGQGLRVIDVSDPYVPVEVGHFVPPAWPGGADISGEARPFYGSDAAVDWKRRLVFVTDRTDQGGAGFYVLKWTGDDQERPINFNPQ